MIHSFTPDNHITSNYSYYQTQVSNTKPTKIHTETVTVFMWISGHPSYCTAHWLASFSWVIYVFTPKTLLINGTPRCVLWLFYTLQKCVGLPSATFTCVQDQGKGKQGKDGLIKEGRTICIACMLMWCMGSSREDVMQSKNSNCSRKRLKSSVCDKHWPTSKDHADCWGTGRVIEQSSLNKLQSNFAKFTQSFISVFNDFFPIPSVMENRMT